MGNPVSNERIPGNALAAPEVVRNFRPDFFRRMHGFTYGIRTEEEHPVTRRTVPRIPRIRERIESRGIRRTTSRNHRLLNETGIVVLPDFPVLNHRQTFRRVLLDAFH